MTAEKYTELVSLNEKAGNASWFLTAAEFLALFASGKVITQMWSLLLVIQFVSYMGTWQIRIDETTSVVITNTRKIVLNEIFDEYGISAAATSAIGINYDNNGDGVSEKVGKDRLNDQTGLLESLGPTLILLSVIVILAIAIITILVVVLKQYKSDSVCSRWVTKARKKIFYGMIIRYFLMNALKLNMTLIVDLRESDDKTLAIVLLVLL